jgi:hypothetical protein
MYNTLINEIQTSFKSHPASRIHRHHQEEHKPVYGVPHIDHPTLLRAFLTDTAKHHTTNCFTLQPLCLKAGFFPDMF